MCFLIPQKLKSPESWFTCKPDLCRKSLPYYSLCLQSSLQSCFFLEFLAILLLSYVLKMLAFCNISFIQVCSLQHSWVYILQEEFWNFCLIINLFVPKYSNQASLMDSLLESNLEFLVLNLLNYLISKLRLLPTF